MYRCDPIVFTGPTRKFVELLTPMLLSNRFKTAGKNNREAFYDEVGKALLDYVADRLRMERATLNKPDIALALTQQGVTEDTAQAFVNVLQECEYARYAPADTTHSVNDFFSKALTAIDRVENELKTSGKK